MIKKYIKQIMIATYKTVLYFIILGVFIILMGRVNPSLVKLTRTSVIVVFAFSLVTIMMIPVYGNFEIGQRKSKPVFFSTVVSIFMADAAAFLVLVIMGINQYSGKLLFTKGLLFLAATFGVQLFISWFAAHFGNEFYFMIHEPAQTILIQNESTVSRKVVDYILSHDKQFELVNIYDLPQLKEIEFKDVDSIFSVGMGNDFENQLIEYCYYHDINLFHDSDVYDMFAGDTKTRVIDDILMNYYPREKITFFQKIIKRLIDIFASIIFLVVASPIFLIVAIAIRLDDGGPIFYKQERLTKNNRIFKIIKFRSMKLNSGNTPVQNNDDRITKVGHTLRRYRIDEIPQFINILMGDMSLVGPRPESIEIMANILEDVPEFEYRLKVKGGLTGYAQIFGKYNTSPRQKILLDMKYIESFSIVNDIKLILQTFSVFFKSDSTEAFEED